MKLSDIKRIAVVGAGDMGDRLGPRIVQRLGQARHVGVLLVSQLDLRVLDVALVERLLHLMLGHLPRSGRVLGAGGDSHDGQRQYDSETDPAHAHLPCPGQPRIRHPIERARPRRGNGDDGRVIGS